MKINRMLFAFSFLLISSTVFGYESYDYSPIDDNEYYYGDDNYYGNVERMPRENYYYKSSKSRKRYADSYSENFSDDNYTSFSNTKNRFVGAGKTFVFDPKQLRWYAFYNGNLINTGRASGGRFYCPDIHRPCKTPVGVFRIGHKGGPDCKSSKYPVGKGNAPMPWCMFFHGGFAIHGSWAVPNFNASHGCIRVPPPDARWLNQQFLSPGSRVIVKSYR